MRSTALAPTVTLGLALAVLAVPARAAGGDPPLAAGPDLDRAAVAASVLGAMDPDADPCADFYRHACGGWIDATELPADQSRWSRSFSVVHERNRETVRALVEAAAAASGAAGQVGRFYAACMDEATIERRGVEPLAPTLARIDAVASPAEAVTLAGELQASGPAPFFDVAVYPDFEDPTTTVAHYVQGGLGLPERDYYLSDDAERVAIRDAYVRHVARMLTLLGETPERAADLAGRVLAFETELARASRTPAAMRRSETLQHRLDAAGLAALAPRLPWASFHAALGAPEIRAINVQTPEFFVALDLLVPDAEMETLRAYLRYQLVTGTATSLADAVYQPHFDFYGRTLAGQKEPQPRWKRCLGATDAALGEAVGAMFVDARFAGASRAIVQEMLGDLTTAFEASLPGLSWMDEPTRVAAREKKATLGAKIGHPDVYRDYAPIEVRPDDHFGNARRAARFEVARLLAKVGGPSDPTEWAMLPHTVNASYAPLYNLYTYPAGILQPPFFHKDFPAAISYGAIGSGMGHELTHGFDDEGRKFDAEGRLRDWWTPYSVELFEERAACVERQYGAYEVEPGLTLDGRLTLGENIADVGGLKRAWEAWNAWRARHPERAAETVGELTPEQLFFVAFGQIWCQEATPEISRLLARTDPHSPGRYRVNGTVTNHPAFAATFSCAAGTPMNPIDKCEVW